MPLSATIEDIKAYQSQVEKNKITSEGLPPCMRCQLESFFFKTHAYRERRFLLVIEMLVQAVFCTLVRFRCTRCGKTFTYYPEFALPHKHYTRQTIENFSKTYVEDDSKSYETVIMTDEGMPVYPDNQREMAGSTVYRWISTIALIIVSSIHNVLANTTRETKPHLQTPHHIAIPKKKYRSAERNRRLLICRHFFNLLSIEQSGFHRVGNIM